MNRDQIEVQWEQVKGLAKSVNNGVVLLADNPANLSDSLRAVECASSVPGVRTVGSGWQRLRAGWIARSTRGVRAVEDDLTI